MARLNGIKTPMDKLNTFINWEMFRYILNEALAQKEQKGPGGAPHYDYVFMFKILVFQRYYNLSDERAEFTINDSLSAQRFLGITLSDQVPDHNKIWEFRERLMKAGVVERLFEMFDRQLARAGIVGIAGSIVDASFVESPKQRNTREENKMIKEGQTPPEWKENKSKLSHKDTDARWTKKDGVNYFGYKDHVKVDAKSKLIRNYTVTSANVHDSQAVEELVNKDDEGKPLYGDSAYTGQAVAEILSEFGIENKIHEKGYRNKPLTEAQKEKNREKSKVRARVEHPFGFMENSMGGMEIRTIGLNRAKTQIGLKNLVYNFARYAFLMSRCGVLSLSKCA
ncbi:MAG: IS5 family transposase [Brevinematales bacterium]|nr:IS5 family transposase [Brevinematales bacterium]